MSDTKMEILGEGAFGRVSLFYRNNTPFVLKESKNPRHDTFFFREVTYLKALNGAGGAPEVVGVSEELHAIIASFRGRYTLLRRLASGVLSDYFILRIALRVAQRLQEVHDAGVIHNDLKADNIMLQVSDEFQDGFEVFIIDFGMATFSRNRLGSKFRSYHMAPEVRLGNAGVPKSDVFSLGVLFRDMKECLGDIRVYHVMEWICCGATEINLKERSSLTTVMEALKETIALVESRIFLPPAQGPSVAVSQPPEPSHDVRLWKRLKCGTKKAYGRLVQKCRTLIVTRR